MALKILLQHGNFFHKHIRYGNVVNIHIQYGKVFLYKQMSILNVYAIDMSFYFEVIQNTCTRTESSVLNI
jgi:hypothetical protein